MRDKRDFWQQIAMSAIMSGRATAEIAVRTADEMVEQYEKRRKQWDAEEECERRRVENSRRGEQG